MHKLVRVSMAAYSLLLAHKRKNESLSEVIIRMVPPSNDADVQEYMETPDAPVVRRLQLLKKRKPVRKRRPRID